MKKIFASKKWGRGIVALATAVFLSACAVGPDYIKPDVKTPDAFKYAAKDEKKAVFQEKWWNIFGDVLLGQLIEEAESGNYDLAAAVERVNQARAVAGISRSAQYPSVSADPSFNRQGYSETVYGSTGATVNTWSLPFNVGYELDLFGSVRRGYEAALADAEAVGEALNSARLVLQTDVARNYFDMRSLDDEIRIVSKMMEIRREEIDLMKRRHEMGVISRLPIAQADAELNATKATLFSLQRSRARLENAIIVLLGKAPSEISLHNDPLKDDPPGPPQVVPSALLTARPDIRLAERQLAAENARVGVATAEFYPRISLGATAGWTTSHSGELFDTRSYTWGIGPNIHIPLFEGGKLRAGLEKSRARYAEVYDSYRQTVIRAFGEVEDSMVSVNMLVKEAEANRMAVASAQEAYQISRKQFEGGLSDYLAVLDSERTWLERLRLESQLRGQQYTSVLGLVKAVGGRW